ncbi:hypothetical protein DCS_00367 [Drechmeria coniospora]|uniref:Uncharacterized protein n=1 Tax=Drechmeria coniospora TaxID=98403 RepID=A0A151GQ46_DRECN|nr:hypothetical protein DCS_00367 [Drechmeria coniospora]KYK59237.1 hypothetical protein DCS_00367 [Drechmeria coniospora]
MSSRVEKTKSGSSRKTLARRALAIFIEEFGFEMPSCSSCRVNRRTCLVAEGKNNRVIREKDRLARQYKQVEEALEEAMARLQCIRKQEIFAEMVARSVESMDELDAEERREVEAAVNALPTDTLSSIDWASLELPEEFILGPSPGDTAQTTAGGLSNS